MSDSRKGPLELAYERIAELEEALRAISINDLDAVRARRVADAALAGLELEQ